jgi:hypothetical protein
MIRHHHHRHLQGLGFWPVPIAGLVELLNGRPLSPYLFFFVDDNQTVSEE